MKKVSILLLVLVALSTFSCSSDDNDGPNNTDPNAIDFSGSFIGTVNDSSGFSAVLEVVVNNRTISTFSPQGAPAGIQLPPFSNVSIGNNGTFSKTVNGIGEYTYSGSFEGGNTVSGTWQCVRNGNTTSGTFSASK